MKSNTVAPKSSTSLQKRLTLNAEPIPARAPSTSAGSTVR